MTTTALSRKALQGTVAAAAGAALLLGGLGTFATWTSDIQAGVETVHGGALAIESYQTGTWTVNGVEIDDIASFHMVPGDVLVREDVAHVLAFGDNLQFTASADFASASTPTGVSVAVDVTGSDLDLSTDLQDLPVLVTITFDEGNADNHSASVDLSDLTVTLTQTH